MKATADNKFGINTKEKKKWGEEIFGSFWQDLEIRSGRRIRWRSGLEQQTAELKADLIPGMQFRKIPEQVLQMLNFNCY